jgi:DNA-binding GntR family transcriptional regulator
MESLGLRAAGSGPRRTAHEYVRDSLRAAILGGRLSGGSRLVQADIARELGVSTTPVREALRDLATEGLVRLDAHRGGVVQRLTFADLHEIHELCRLLEPEAMRTVAEIVDDSLLAEASDLAAQMQAQADPAEWTVLNRQFHATLVAAIPSLRLQGILRSLRDSAAPYVALAIRSRGVDQFATANAQHAEILEALASRDADRCAELTRIHVDLTVRALEESRHLFDGTSDIEPPPDGS